MADSRRVVPIVLGVLGLVVIGAVFVGLRTGRLAEEPPPQVEEDEPVRAEIPEIMVFDPVGLFDFPGDWDEIEATTLTLWYPGQSSWQWLVSEEHAGGGAAIAGTSCVTCHAGQEAALGASLVQANNLEDSPIPDKRPIIDLAVRAAYDDQYVYMQLAWEASNPGTYHMLYRYDGTEWVRYGGPKPDVLERDETPSYENSISFLLDDTKNVPAFAGVEYGFTEMGCFITCHDSLRTMPDHPTPEQVREVDYWRERAVLDIRKYLLVSRFDFDGPGAGWNNVRTQEELDRLRAEGMFLDLWHWRAARSNPVGYAGDDWVLEYRNFDEGENAWITEWMYNADIVGANAVTVKDMQRNIRDLHLVENRTVAPLRADIQFEEGDILPQIKLQEPEGSAADILANGQYHDGVWTVELRRALDPGNPDDKVLEEGRVYDVAYAIHDDFVSNRRHHVSWSYTLGIGAPAQIQAVRVNGDSN